MRRRALHKGISPAVATAILIGVAIAAVLMVYAMLPTAMQQGRARGASIEIANAKLEYLGNLGGKHTYMLSISIQAGGADVATITKIEIYGPDGSKSWQPNTVWQQNLNIKVYPGQVYQDLWTFDTGGTYKIGVDYTYIVKVYYKDPLSSNKKAETTIRCIQAIG